MGAGAPGDRVYEAAPAASPPASAEWPTAGAAPTGDDYDPFATLTASKSLADHLNEQAQLAFASAHDRLIARYLIDLVDGDGYIRTPLEEVCGQLSLSAEEVERMLLRFRLSIRPAFARETWRNVLRFSSRRKTASILAWSVSSKIWNSSLPAISSVSNGFAASTRKTCANASRSFAQLNPRPGSGFEHVEIETLVPDVIVRRGPDGEWRAELNPGAAPSLAVDRAYYASLKARCRSDADRTYLGDRLSSANWLVKSLEQRLATILKVATAVVEEQSAFFDHGVRHLKPLNLRQIAAKIGMHKSTVSRVTSNKAIATPRGLFEMKYFFTSAISAASASAEAHSSEAVRDRIKEFILNENPTGILSDDRIVTLLKADGIDIARRTVAKYREALRIPSSAARRRQKRAATAA